MQWQKGWAVSPPSEVRPNRHFTDFPMSLINSNCVFRETCRIGKCQKGSPSSLVTRREKTENSVTPEFHESAL